MRGTLVTELALRSYPTWWKDRYADEVRSVTADLRAEGRSGTRLALDLLRGSIRARTRTGGMPPVYRLWATRTRLSIAMATLSWLVVAPLVLMTMGSPSLHATGGRVVSFADGPFLIGSQLQLFPAHVGLPRPAPPVTPAGTIVLWAGLAVVALFLVTLVVLAVGWSRLTTGIQRSSSPHRRSAFLLAWSPGFALLTDVGLVAALTVLHPSRYHSTTGGAMVPVNGDPAAVHVLAVVLAITAIAGWPASIAGVAVAVKRADLAPVDLRFGRTVSVVVSALLVALLVAYATWGVGLVAQARQAAGGGFTTITYPNQALWPLMLLTLAGAALLAATGAKVAVRTWRMISPELG